MKPLRLSVAFARAGSLSPFSYFRPIPTKSLSRSFTTGRRVTMEGKSNRDLFSYSSGRFLYNEQLRLQERHVEFNIAALEDAACQYTSRSKVVDLVKLSEGGFNRVLLLTFDDGFKAVVKIPYNLCVPTTYTTASEVATLAFLRRKGAPVPDVYGWSSTADNAVGAEYIIMEFVSDMGLDTKWFGLTKVQQRDLALGIVEIEKNLLSIPFGSIGSLYFKKDIPPEAQTDLYAAGTPDPDGDSDTFCIGPIADYMFWYGQRSQLEGVDHGPWKEPHDYVRAIGKRELEWTQRFGKPLENDYPHNTLIPGVNSQEDYSNLLRKYLTLCPHLLPKDPQDPRNKPTIRHPDLTPSNVFVNPETFKITKIIDWQHTIITPLLLAAGHPRLFENPDAEPPETLEAPQPPEGYDSLDSETKSQVDELLRRRYLFYLYRVLNGAKNKLHLSAFYDPILLPRQHLVEYAGRQWSGNLMTLRGALIRMHDYWSLLATKLEKCPIDFSEAELKKHYEEEPTWFDATALVNYWRDELGGLSEEGWVRTEMYDHAMKENEGLRAKFFNDADSNEKEKITQGWPFQDREEFY